MSTCWWNKNVIVVSLWEMTTGRVYNVALTLLTSGFTDYGSIIDQTISQASTQIKGAVDEEWFSTSCPCSYPSFMVKQLMNVSRWTVVIRSYYLSRDAGRLGVVCWNMYMLIAKQETACIQKGSLAASHLLSNTLFNQASSQVTVLLPSFHNIILILLGIRPSNRWFGFSDYPREYFTECLLCSCGSLSLYRSPLSTSYYSLMWELLGHWNFPCHYL